MSFWRKRDASAVGLRQIRHFANSVFKPSCENAKKRSFQNMFKTFQPRCCHALRSAIFLGFERRWNLRRKLRKAAYTGNFSHGAAIKTCHQKPANQRHPESRLIRSDKNTFSVTKGNTHTHKTRVGTQPALQSQGFAWQSQPEVQIRARFHNQAFPFLDRCAAT